MNISDMDHGQVKKEEKKNQLPSDSKTRALFLRSASACISIAAFTPRGGEMSSKELVKNKLVSSHASSIGVLHSTNQKLQTYLSHNEGISSPNPLQHHL